jgi:hypothetical protein
MESNRNEDLKGINPNTENHDLKESNRNQEFKGNKSKTGIEWNQMETMFLGFV